MSVEISHIVIRFINGDVRCDESSLYSRINYVHSPDGELLCGSVRE